MKIIRKQIETAEALAFFLSEIQSKTDKLWPKTLTAFEREGLELYDEEEARCAWETAVAVTDTYLMGETRSMSGAELSNIFAALDAKFESREDKSGELYDNFKAIIAYASIGFESENGRLRPLIAGIAATMHYGLARVLEDDIDPDDMSLTYPKLLSEISILFSMQLTAWRHVFENYKVNFT